MSGWIKLHRDIQKHWIFSFKEPDKALAWIDLLLLANHDGNEFLIKGRIITCNRGQVAMSQITLQKRWSMSQNKLKRFLEVLKNQSMIDFETNDLTTIITICNYNKFQHDERSDERPDERPDERTTNEPRTNRRTTNKNVNNYKNEKNEKNEKKERTNTYTKKTDEEILILSDYGIDGTLAKDFLAHRRKKGSSISETVMNGFQREADKAGISITDAITESIERNWVAFRSDWYQNQKTTINQKPNKLDATISAAQAFLGDVHERY